MLGKNKIIIIFLLFNFYCLGSNNKQDKLVEKEATLWESFKEGIKCSMTRNDFIKYCEDHKWKSVNGTRGYSSKEFKIVTDNGDTVKKIFSLYSGIIIGNPKDSAKLYIEFSDSTGEWTIRRIWYTKESIDYIFSNIVKIRRSKDICGSKLQNR